MVGGALSADGPGWVRFPADAQSLNWTRAALGAGQAVLRDSIEPWRCGGTWFVGVDALANDADGAVAGQPLAGAAVKAVRDLFGPRHWHPAQLSVIRPGYPQPSPDESPAAFVFRRDRDAAHVDGLIADGPGKRRFIREPHAFILGIALNHATADASPLVVWEGSHGIIGAAFRGALAGANPTGWDQVDITDAYQAARRTVLAQCPRRTLPLRPGEAVLLHRHLLHGVSPWGQQASAAAEGRAIAYFRPECATVADWAQADDPV